jgi:hypothetical protein
MRAINISPASRFERFKPHAYQYVCARHREPRQLIQAMLKGLGASERIADDELQELCFLVHRYCGARLIDVANGARFR